MKTLYNKTFDYYNSDQTVNARLVLNIELNKWRKENNKDLYIGAGI